MILKENYLKSERKEKRIKRKKKIKKDPILNRIFLLIDKE